MLAGAGAVRRRGGADQPGPRQNGPQVTRTLYAPMILTSKHVQHGPRYSAIALAAAAMLVGCEKPTYDFEAETRQWRNIELRPPGDGPYLVLDLRVALLLFTESDCAFYFERLQEHRSGYLSPDLRSQMASVRDSLVDLNPAQPPLDTSYTDVFPFAFMAARLLQWGKGSVYHKKSHRYVRTVTIMRWRTGNVGGRRFDTVDTGEYLFEVTDYIVD